MVNGFRSLIFLVWDCFIDRRRHRWAVAVQGFVNLNSLPITCFMIDATDSKQEVPGLWQERYGVQNNGAVLVCPDHIVAWRSKSERIYSGNFN